jgi:uncharacterized membrane protein (Fun14 family)
VISLPVKKHHKKSKRWNRLLFFVRFLLFSVIGLIAWWALSKIYAMVLLRVTMYTIGILFMKTTGNTEMTASIISSGSRLLYCFSYDGSKLTLIANHIFLNAVPFVALILSSSKPKFGKKIKAMLIGLSALFLLHCVTIVIYLYLDSAFSKQSLIYMTVGHIEVMVKIITPFTLWIILGDRSMLRVR